MESDYKTAKESFVSGTTGSSVLHVNSVSLVALVSIILYASLSTRLPSTRKINFVLSWVLLIFPLLLSMTLFAEAPLLLSLLLAIPACVLLLLPRRDLDSPLPSKQPKPTGRSPRFPLLLALTAYRSHMMLMTVLAILAVDFPVFPRMLAKCESFGASLMDLGVGSFVFSQGLVSAIPFVSQPYYLLEPVQPKLYKTMHKTLPIFLLGVIRVLLVKGTDYPEHVTEYGVHWNFFLTLSLIPILQVLLHPILLKYPISLISIFVALAQQTLLSQLGLQAYVLSDERGNLISANKEGIVSLLGYLSVHLLGLSAGTIILPYSPSFFRRHQAALSIFKKTGNKARYFDEPPETKYRQSDKTAAEVFSYAVIWWVMVGLLSIGGRWGFEGGISRRLVNLPYIIWVAAFNTSFLLGYFVILDILFYPQSIPSKDVKQNLSTLLPTGDRAPPLLAAINRHGLTIFLLANLLTGAVNLTIPTMYTSTFLAMVILVLYSIVLCGIVWMLEYRS